MIAAWSRLQKCSCSIGCSIYSIYVLLRISHWRQEGMSSILSELDNIIGIIMFMPRSKPCILDTSSWKRHHLLVKKFWLSTNITLRLFSMLVHACVFSMLPPVLKPLSWMHKWRFPWTLLFNREFDSSLVWVSKWFKSTHFYPSSIPMIIGYESIK